MAKNISSEIKFSDIDFKIKIGTMDKKNPETLYVQIGTYLQPNELKNSYTEDVFNIDKLSKTFLSKRLKNSLEYSKNYILVVDIAEERITLNKKSFLDIQIHFKTLKKQNKAFKTISNELYNEQVVDYVSFLKENLNEIGFNYFKTKK